MSELFIAVQAFNGEIDVGEVRLPAKYEVCGRCAGRGVHDHPAFSNGITSDEWHSPDWDDESRESYMRGDYDVPCSVCRGQRVVLVPDEDAFNAEQRAAWAAEQQLQAAMAAEAASERILRWHENGGHF